MSNSVIHVLNTLKAIMMLRKIFIGAIWSATVMIAVGQNAHLRYLKHVGAWTLINTTADSLGNYNDVTLKYVQLQGNDGAYHNGDPDTVYLYTPNIAWNLDSFAITLEFKTIFDTRLRPVFVLGGSFRWFSAWIDPDGDFGNNFQPALCVYNKDGYYFDYSKDCTPISDNRWYKLAVVHIGDSTYVYLDGQLKLKLYHPSDSFQTGWERNASLYTRYGGGNQTFKGWIRRLNVYNGGRQVPLTSAYPDDAPYSVTYRQGTLFILDPTEKIRYVRVSDLSGKVLLEAPVQRQAALHVGQHDLLLLELISHNGKTITHKVVAR